MYGCKGINTQIFCFLFTNVVHLFCKLCVCNVIKTKNMKKLLLIIIILAFGLLSKAQEQTVTFYKDGFLKKEVKEKKANFKKVETVDSEGIIHVKVYDLFKNWLISEEIYNKNRTPTGIWTTRSGLGLKKWDFSKLVYADKEMDSIYRSIGKELNDNLDIDNDKIAQFGENEHSLFQYLLDNLEFPREALERDIKGVVRLRFAVKKDGSVEVIAILDSAHPLLDYTAWELIEKMPKWKPATKNGKPIESYFHLPISFMLTY